jgi:hypothetical protein
MTPRYFWPIYTLCKEETMIITNKIIPLEPLDGPAPDHAIPPPSGWPKPSAS